jgi:hypothetical protein
MYLRTTRRQNKDGSEAVYYQLAETVYNKEKRQPQARVIHNFGRAEDVDPDGLRRLANSILRVFGHTTAEGAASEVEMLESFDFGLIYAVEALWEQLGLSAILRGWMKHEGCTAPYERILMALVANRLDLPTSKLGCFERWFPKRPWLPESLEWKLEQVYRSLDFLLAHIRPIEEEIFNRVANLFNADVDLIFYDTTTLYFEIDEEDEVNLDFPQNGPLRKRGHNKEGRDGNPQVVVGLALTRDGLPVRSWVFPGNTADVTTIGRIRDDLRGWRLNRTILVGDAGMYSEENKTKLSQGLGRYILAVPIRKVKEVKEQVLTRAGRYQVVKDNLEVKEVIVGAGERRQRYILCRNPEEADREAQHRAKILNQLDAELALLDAREEAHPKKACDLMASRRFGKYLMQDAQGRLTIDEAKVQAEEKLDGKYVLTTNDDTLTAEDAALGYKAAMLIEGCFRRMKTSGLRTRPIFHWRPRRIEAHVKLCVLALLVERAAEIRAEMPWLQIATDLGPLKAVKYLEGKRTIVQTTKPDEKALSVLTRLGIPKPARVLSISE